jgi:hypothetical protein
MAGTACWNECSSLGRGMRETCAERKGRKERGGGQVGRGRERERERERERGRERRAREREREGPRSAPDCVRARVQNSPVLSIHLSASPRLHECARVGRGGAGCGGHCQRQPSHFIQPWRSRNSQTQSSFARAPRRSVERQIRLFSMHRSFCGPFGGVPDTDCVRIVRKQRLTSRCKQRVFLGSFLGRPCIMKERFSKAYRHPELDAKLTSKRTVQVCGGCTMLCPSALSLTAAQADPPTILSHGF